MRQPLRKHRSGPGRKEINQADRLQVIQAFTSSLIGLALGGLASYAGVVGMGWGVPTALAVMAGCWALAFFGPLALSTLSGRATARLHSPSGRLPTARRQYSHAESLAARGLYQEAIDEFEIAISEDPADATPYLRVARIYRDRLTRYEDAARWFKRALAESTMPAARSHATTRELVELYGTQMGEPARAAPLLARLAEEQAGTPEGTWAAEELARVKSTLDDRGAD